MQANSSSNPKIDALLGDAARGDRNAWQWLLETYRVPLRKRIAARLDPRLAPRLDPSDVVQETLSDAADRLPEYVRDRPLPLHAWLYRLAMDRLRRTHRYHVKSSARKISREVRIEPTTTGDITPARDLHLLAAEDTTPARRVAREEGRRLLAAAIESLEAIDREILTLRYIEPHSFEEIATSLGIGLAAAKMRHMRALDRLRGRLEGMGLDLSQMK